MTTFTVTGDWTAQGDVNGNVNFYPRPSSAGAPVGADISSGTLSVELPVIDGSYLVAFNGVTLNGALGVIESFVFPALTGGTISLNTIVSPPPNVLIGQQVYRASSLDISPLGAQLIQAESALAGRQLLAAAPALAYFVDEYGADPTGVHSSDSAVADALAEMGTAPGILVFGVGNYRLSQTITLSGNQGAVGQGIEFTTLEWVGTGQCIELHDAVTVYPPSKTGLIQGMKISGLGAGAGSAGIEAGDIYNLRIRDVWICDFVAAGSIGLHMLNAKQLSERAQVVATIDNCATQVVFEHSETGDPSFSYSDWDFEIKAFANQNGVVIRNGIMTHSRLSIRGNCFNADTSGGFGTRDGTMTAAGSNTGVALTVGETDTDTARIQACELFIGLENGGIAGATPCHTTLNIGADAFLWASGTINYFALGDFTPAWTAGAQHGWMSFAGFKNIDATYGVMVSPQTLSYGGALSGGGGNVSGNTINLATGNSFILTLASGDNALVFDTGGGLDGFACYELLLIQPSDGAATVTLPGNAYAVPTPLSLTTTAGEIDVLRVYTFDHNSYFVVQLTAR